MSLLKRPQADDVGAVTQAVGEMARSALIPKEHALWSWAVLPLLCAALVAPSVSMVAAASAVFVGYGAAHALPAALRGRPGQGFWTASVLWLLLSATAAFHAPPLAMVALGIVSLVAAVLVGLQGHAPHHAGLEALGVVAFTGVGALLALLAHTNLPVLACFGALLAWQLVSLWWIRRGISKVLARRVPWTQGPLWWGGTMGVSAALAVWWEAPSLAVIPLFYVLRIAVHAPLRGPKDLKRVGITEGVWALAITLLVASVWHLR